MATPLELYNEAEWLKSEGKLEEAVSKLREALEIDDKYALAHSALAVALQKLDRHDEAIVHAEVVCTLEPQDPFSYTALSVTYQRAFAGTGEMKFIQMAEDAMARSRDIQSQK